MVTSRSGGRSTKRARTTREANLSETRLTLTHHPAGIAVGESLPVDRYSRTELRAATEELRRRLMVELAERVSKPSKK